MISTFIPESQTDNCLFSPSFNGEFNDITLSNARNYIDNAINVAHEERTRISEELAKKFQEVLEDEKKIKEF